MKKYYSLIPFFVMAFSDLLYASELEVPNSFSAGTPAVAAEVNENFTAIETAVNDNNSTIVSLQAQVQTLNTENASLQQTLGALQAAVTELQNTQTSTITYVVSPRVLESNYQDFDLNENRGVFTIHFNVALDDKSVIVDENVTVSGSGGSGTGTIEWLEGGAALRYTMMEEFTAVSPCFSGGLDLTIKGEGENPVTDKQGKAIDGDKNGLPGGDFVVNFDVVC
ncbi:hypothetical protein TDB9533_01975 [Thalassocella blandensis]|nr:hypothetical protein TDB9533_01975 [Thalassocella blandensis]